MNKYFQASVFTNIIPALFILVIVASCKKDSNENSDKTTIITAGNWKLASYTISTTTGTIDLYSTYSACRRDDYLHFNSGGSGEINEGPSKCNSTDPQSQVVQWSFSDNADTKIKINGIDYAIDKLDGNSLQLHSISSDPFASQESKAYNK